MFVYFFFLKTIDVVLFIKHICEITSYFLDLFKYIIFFCFLFSYCICYFLEYFGNKCILKLTATDIAEILIVCGGCISLGLGIIDGIRTASSSKKKPNSVEDNIIKT